MKKMLVALLLPVLLLVGCNKGETNTVPAKTTSLSQNTTAFKTISRDVIR